MAGHRGVGLVALREVVDEVDRTAHPEDGPKQAAQAVVAPAPESAAQAGESKDRGDEGTSHATGPAARTGFLDMDPAVRFRKEGPCQAVDQYADPGQEGQDDEDAADDDGVHAKPVGDAAADAADPAVVAPVDALAADPAEEIDGRSRGSGVALEGV